MEDNKLIAEFMGMKYSDKKVDPEIVMKAYNANKSPKEAAKMFKK